MTISSAGIAHFAFGGVGFLALIVACFVLARRFSVLQQRGWSAFGVITGVVFFLAFAGLSSGSGKRWTFIGFLLGVTMVWVWLSSVSAKLRAELPDRLQ
jgi:hypothetical protein